MPLDSNWGMSRSIHHQITTLQSHRTHCSEVEILSFQASQWRQIYSFLLSTNPTSHYQCVLVVVGCTANRLSIITVITMKSKLFKLNELECRQIWISNPFVESLSNATEWTWLNALTPSLTDCSWGRSVDSVQLINQTNQWEWRSPVETSIANINGLEHWKLSQFKTGQSPEHAIPNHQWLQWLKRIEWEVCHPCCIKTPNPQVFHIQWNEVQFGWFPHNMTRWQGWFASKTDEILQTGRIERWWNGRMRTWRLEGMGVPKATSTEFDSIGW